MRRKVYEQLVQFISICSADSFINTFNMTHPNKPLTPRVVIHHQKKTNKKALHSQKRDSDLWVSQKWPTMIPKVGNSLEKGRKRQNCFKNILIIQEKVVTLRGI